MKRLFLSLFGNKKGNDGTPYNYVINKIKENLTGDNIQDLSYLKCELDHYKDHEYSKEIIRAIGRMIAERLPKEAIKKQ